MSIYESKLRQEKKVELSRKVSLALVDEIWEKSWAVNDADEFVDYLMTITDEDAIEEFFNKCHAEDGRFCGGPGGKGGPGTRRPAPIDYIKQRATTAISTHKGKVRSASVNRVTTGAVRRILSLSTAYGSVKVHRLSKTNLNNFTDKDLGTIRKQLFSDQRRYNLMNTTHWAIAGGAFARSVGHGVSVAGPAGIAAVAAGSLIGVSVGLGLARYKTRRIPGQIQRVERELTKRGQTFEVEVMDFAFEFAVEDEDNLPSLAQEIAQAKRDIEEGNGPKNLKKPSADELSELGKMIDALEVDAEEGITAEMIKHLKKTFAMVSADRSNK